MAVMKIAWPGVCHRTTTWFHRRSSPSICGKPVRSHFGNRFLVKYSHRHRFNFLLFLVWLINWLGLWTIMIVYVFLFRWSFRATNNFPSFPFSGTHYLLRTNNVHRRKRPTTCIWFANHVGSMYVPSPWSVNPVAIANFLIALVSN